MPALIDLFTSFSGLLSLGIIVFICLMGAYIARMAMRKVEEESRASRPLEIRVTQPRKRH